MGRPVGSKVERGSAGRRVAANIRRLREDRGLSLQALAGLLERAGRPMLPTAISKVEQSDRRVDVDDLVAFAEALDVSTDELLYGGAPEGLATFDYIRAISAYVRAGYSERILAVDPRDWDRLWELAQRRGMDPNRPGFWKQIAGAARRDGMTLTPAELRELWEHEDEEPGRE